jgi:hypothetical protein
MLTYLLYRFYWIDRSSDDEPRSRAFALALSWQIMDIHAYISLGSCSLMVLY